MITSEPKNGHAFAWIMGNLEGQPSLVGGTSQGIEIESSTRVPSNICPSINRGMTMIKIEPAVFTDVQSTHELLTGCGLSTLEVLEPGTVYLVAHLGEKLVGVCGLEFDGESALLRSVAVDNGSRGRGIARAMIDEAFRELHRRSIRTLFLFSKDTGAYFERLGWMEVSVSEAADALRQAPQVRRYDRTGWYLNERAFRLHLAGDIQDSRCSAPASGAERTT